MHGLNIGTYIVAFRELRPRPIGRERHSCRPKRKLLSEKEADPGVAAVVMVSVGDEILLFDPEY